MLDAIMQRYPAYTLSTLLQEDAELLRMMAILNMGQDPAPEFEPSPELLNLASLAQTL